MRKAFTFMELIFVIVIAGILLAVAIPRLSTVDELQVATDQVISHIRYAQSLALMDDKYSEDIKHWRKNYWRVRIGTQGNADYAGVAGGWTYHIFYTTVASGNDTPRKENIARDPLTGLLLTGGTNLGSANIKTKDATKEMALTYTYNIDKISFSSNQSIAFNELGVPHIIRSQDGSTRKIEKPYKITLHHKSGDKMLICVEPETGYTHRCD